MGVYADHHEGGPGDSDRSVSEAAEVAEEAKEETASMEEKAEASATDAGGEAGE